jgi:hypothetical protein
MDRCCRECVPVHNMRKDHECKTNSWSNGLCRPKWRQGPVFQNGGGTNILRCRGIFFRKPTVIATPRHHNALPAIRSVHPASSNRPCAS